MINRMVKGARIRVSGVLLEDLLDLPEDARIFKIIHSDEPDYTWDILYHTGEGFLIPEGGLYPLKEGK
jgi:hypothetical protein